MRNFGTNLQSIREQMGMNKKEFAEYLGVAGTTVDRYEKNDMTITLPVVEKIAAKLGMRPGELLGWETPEKTISLTECKIVPVIGDVEPGTPIMSHGNIVGHECLNPDITNVDFCFKVKGNCFKLAGINDGHIVYISRTDTVEDGDIVLLVWDKEPPCLKRVYHVDGGTVLRCDDPAEFDKLITTKQEKDLHIIGKAILCKGVVK